ncbi:MAG: Ig-like domain-containing protein [Bacteroidales bacterium]|nr:Ig-like domain-containing protein [Bacteroidales bacterium]MCF8455756.1 Ig-like domain-containing protein [Bacteroidales bacterium]
MKRKKQISNTLFRIGGIVFLFSLLSSCANMGMPEGGPKDETPPKVVESEPANFSTHFKSQKIIITFDEYIVLKNLTQKLIISPPLPEKPEIKLKGKKLYIELNNELADSTTYTLNFGDAIVDNNEGNVMQNFQFVFATGDKLDSLSISGKINNAFTKLAESEVLVMVYSELADTMPMKVIPEYVARSLPNGSFSINNMRSATYKLFALRDANNNYLFDQPNEAIAYLDTFLTPFAILKEHIDTIPRNTLPSDTISADTLINTILPPDTLLKDSIVISTIVEKYPSDIQLWLFEEKFNKQYLKSSDRKNKALIKLAFNQAVEDSIKINFLSPDTAAFIPEYHENLDSLFLWLTDSTDFNTDTIRMEISYIRKDSLDEDYLHCDTLKLGFREKEKKKKEKDTEDEKPKGLQFSTLPRINSNLQKEKNFEMIFAEPISVFDTSLIQIYTTQDTNQVRMPYSISKDSAIVRGFHVSAQWEDDKRYEFVADDSAFVSIWGNYTDSTAIIFKTRPIEDYGNIILKLESFDGPGIVQLIGEKESILDERKVKSEETVNFNYLMPGNFKLKFIFDRNGNGKWDTGKYLDKLQPEKTNYFSGEVKVRANWDLELDWDPNQEGLPFKEPEKERQPSVGTKRK